MSGSGVIRNGAEINLLLLLLSATELGSACTTSTEDIPNRRHTIVGCHQDEDDEEEERNVRGKNVQEDGEEEASDMEAAARALDSVDGSSNYGSERTADSQLPGKESKEESDTDDRLSLTLEEIVHIRSVMTKAELEGLPIEVRIKEDVERRKVRIK